jgi:hypothetical protein
VRSRRKSVGLLPLAVAAVLLAACLVAGIARAAGNPPNVDPATEFQKEPPGDEDVPDSPSASNAPRVVPGNAGVNLSRSANVTASWEGVNFVDERTADGGNQFSVEPPDQGLCVGEGYVLEAVNTAFAIYTTSGGRVGGVEALNPFFTGDHAIVRSTPPVYGKFLSDPKCYWDPGNKHFYFTVLEIDTDPATGAFGDSSHVLIAVSKGTTPSTNPDDWYHYTLNTTNDGSAPMYTGGPQTPSDDGCPCFGDQPLIGADTYGFFITTNEFSIAGPEFNGAQIYAFDKDALANGNLGKPQYVAGGRLEEGPSYSVQPATSPTTGSWDTNANGTEFFLSALDFDGTADNRIAIWSMTNTHSLTTDTPAAVLTHSVMPSEVYATPSPADQKKGKLALGAALGEPEGLLNSNDDRMNQVVYADGLLWSCLNSEVRTSNGASSQTNRVGIAYFIVKPTSEAPAAGTVQNQGYVSTKQDNVLFPSIGVNESGKGVMVFTVAGQNYFPSAAYVPIDASGVHDGAIYAMGGVPEDGFTCYPEYSPDPPHVCRWGDYSAAVGTPDGTVYIATEWNKQLTYPPYLGNWTTQVAAVRP